MGEQEAGDDDTALGNEGGLPTAEAATPIPAICLPELDLFGDPIPSSKQNGTKEPDAFDLGLVGEALTQPSKEARARTPESFLGPSASSLVNLDSLVKTPQAAKTRNPFLTGTAPLCLPGVNTAPPSPCTPPFKAPSPGPSIPLFFLISKTLLSCPPPIWGLCPEPPPTALSPPLLSRSADLSAPSPTNPFGAGEPGRPTLNQMRTGSPALGLAAGRPLGAPLSSMTYSTSLPLPLSSVPAGVTLPASASAFPRAGAFTPPPASLPPPLLPAWDPAAPPPAAPQAGTNPFL